MWWNKVETSVASCGVALPFAEISDPNYNRGVMKPNV